MNCEESAVVDVLSETMVTDTLVTEIWKRLPEDLFEDVIARLPIAALFRFRSVCQRWKNLVTSQCFSWQRTEVPQVPWFCGITHECPYNGVMFDLSTQKRYLTSFPFIDGRMLLVPETSADGESASEGYKITWLEGRGGNYRVYNSKQNCWTNLCHMPSHIKLPLFLNILHQPIAIGSTLYIMRAAPDGVVSYDMVSGDWKQYIIPFPSHVIDRYMVKCGGRIMLVGLLTKNAASCVCIWELQKMALLWKEVDRMPSVLSLNFCDRPVQMTCGGNQDVVMLSFSSLEGNRFVIYNLLTKNWQEVPSWVRSSRENHMLFLWARSFLPSPTALP